MENDQEVEKKRSIHKKLEERRRILETKINEKCYELKKLCIAEAELTGVIPLEIPLDPDESPPKIKRRIGTMFPYSEEVIHQIQAPTIPFSCKSPKRKIPLCPWNKGSDTLPLAGKAPETCAISPRQHATWSHKKTTSPIRPSGHKAQLYKTKLNSILKKW